MAPRTDQAASQTASTADTENPSEFRDLLTTVRVNGRLAAELSPADCLREDAARAALLGRIQAEQLLLRAQFARSRPAALSGGEQEPQTYDRYAGDELALQLGLAPSEGNQALAFADRVVRRLPRGLRALHDGAIDLPRLRALDQLTAQLDDVQVDAVVQPVLDNGGGRPTLSAFRTAVRRRIARIDPKGAERRSRRARRTRKVGVQAEADGMGRMSALLPGPEMLAAFHRVDQLARRFDPTDERTLDQRRADVFVDLLMGRDREHVDIEMQVIVPLETLTGQADKPGEIPGFGPIPAGIVREMAADPGCTWRRILVDPMKGTIAEVADRRHPSAGLARNVRLRTPTCAFPGCSKPSVDCDLDHTVARQHDGPTTGANLEPLCRHHHGLKHSGDGLDPSEPRWDLTQPSPGEFVWTTPEGFQHRYRPETYPET
ncbi:HNH endonuclease [Frankia sp. AgPm24]|uniref:HNH endonuclease signature motif containing protein n=1 Tax=Frankia sp. AgPm24 TaxID=631128 RepID=UPI00200E981A|nr:HNH endonuclease signature motif containing protein [Frankia sp. AgPm24]MCK9920643.1 HNH endonuclease [Frankia sp. AgPm24]